VTSLSDELGRDVTTDDVLAPVTEAVLAAIEGTLPVREHVVSKWTDSVPGLDLQLR
jgi:lipoyl(octanoyl) transferase